MIDLHPYLQINQAPAPGPLPPGSRLPLPRNPAFSGRREEILAIANYLFSSLESPRPSLQGLILIGTAGAGKTQLAAEFCYRYGRALSGVHWMDGRFDSRAEIAACGVKMSIDPWPDDLSAQVEAVLEAWEDSGALLVVLDHLDHPDQLTELVTLLPPNVCLLVTSRESLPEEEISPPLQNFETLALTPLARSDSLEMLTRLAPRLQDEPQQTLDRLSSWLGDWPLALEMTARFLRAYPSLPAGVHLERLQNYELPKDGISQAIAALFSGLPNNMEGMRETERIRRILTTCAWCAADWPVPLELLSAAAGLTAEGTGSQLEQTLQRFYTLGVLHRTQIGPVMTPLVMESARRLDLASGLAGYKTLVPALVHQVNQAAEHGDQQSLLPLDPHLWTAAHAGAARGLAEAGMLWNELGMRAHRWSEWSAAQEAFARALALMEPTLGSSHHAVLRVIINLGSLLHSRGELAAARAALERAIQSGEAALGAQDPRLAHALAELGAVLQTQGDLPAARLALQRALTLEEAAFGPNHPNLAQRYTALGMLLSELGERQAARDAFRQALEIDQGAYGASSLPVGRDLINLGNALADLGAPRTALETLQRSEQILAERLSPEHPLHIALRNNLAAVLASLGQLGEAEQTLQKVLETQKNVFGERHPEVATALSNLAAVQIQVGKLSQAQAGLRSALEIDEQIFGPQHIRAASDLTSLGRALQAAGDLSGAEQAFQRALELYESSLGCDHPTCLQARLSYGSLLFQEGNLPEAEAVLQQALGLSEQAKESENVITADLLFQLGLVRNAARNPGAARSAFLRALGIYERTYHRSHPQVGYVLRALGDVYRRQGDLHGARAFYRRALSILEPRLPAGHPDVDLLQSYLHMLESELKRSRRSL